MVFSSLYEFEKWHKSIQRRYNNVEDRALQRKEAALNRLHGPPRPDTSSAGRTQQTGATLPPFLRCDIQGPRLTKAQRISNPLQRNGLDALRPSEPPSCPDDCPSKKFCNPSSCALESVRESDAMVEALRRTE